MIDLSDKYLLMIEPKDQFKEEAVDDELTAKMERLFNKAKPVMVWKGCHTAADRMKSDNCDYILPSGHITNSLCVHYMRYHRSEVPRSELTKLSLIQERPMITNTTCWKITDLVTKTNKVQFRYYSHKELWYEVVRWQEYDELSEDTHPEHSDIQLIPLNPPFLFPVPIDDTGDGKFLAEDKSLIFMRYIRKQLEQINVEQQHMKQALA